VRYPRNRILHVSGHQVHLTDARVFNGDLPALMNNSQTTSQRRSGCGYGQFQSVLTSVDPAWEVIPPEDIFVKKRLKAKVQKAIDKAVEAILVGEESSQEEEDSKQEEVNSRNHRAPPFSSNQPEFLALGPSPETDDGTFPCSSNLPLETQQTDAKQPSRHPSSRLVPIYKPDSYFDLDSDEDNHNSTDPENKLPVPSRKTQRNQTVSTTEPLPCGPEQNLLVERPIKPTTRQGCVQNMLFPLETFRLMEGCEWLLDVYDSYRLSYELDHNHLIVHMASPAHDAAANSWLGTIMLWHTNGGTGAQTLRIVGSGRIIHLRYMLTIPEYRWSAGSEKSPDQSFLP
jgi:hypothetical protein